MSLQQQFFDGIEEIFREMDDLVFCGLYFRGQASTYKAGGQVHTDEDPLEIRIIEDTEQESGNDTQGKVSDKAFIVPAVDLKCKAPSTDDKIKDKDGVLYSVSGWETDPSKTSYIIKVDR